MLSVYRLPEGSNAAVIMFYYSGLNIAPWEGKKTTGTGYANIGYNMEVTSNKSGFEMSPGALATSLRIYGDILGWDDGASQIAVGESEQVRLQRTTISSVGTKAVRVDFAESTSESPTRLTFKPFCTVTRVRGCKVSVYTGRLIVMPYYDDGTNWKPFNALTEFAVGNSDDDFLNDDSVVEKGFDERMESVELKNRMNYMTNAIRETLDYDTELAITYPEAPAILEKALNDIFNLKRVQVNSYEYYETELDNIRNTFFLLYLDLQFGFELDENTVRSF